MTLSVMRFIDTVLGVVLCWLFSIIESICSVFRPKSHRRNSSPPQRLLLIKTLGFGTVLITSALIKAIQQQFPRAEIDYFTFEETKPAAQMLPGLHQIHSLPSSSPWRFARSVFSMILRFRARRYDVVFDLDYFSRFTMLVSYLSGTPQRIGFADPRMYRGHLLTQSVPYSLQRHILDQYCDMLEVISGQEIETPQPEIQIDPAAIAAANDILRSRGVEDAQPLVLINPNVSEFGQELRQWPLERFAALADLCVSELKARVLMVGGPSDVEHVAKIISMTESKDVASIAGQTALMELAAICKQADCMISGDTGPMHVATVVGTPVIALFGPTPQTHTPGGKRDRVIRHNISCSPCLTVYNQKSAICVHETNLCMTLITVQQVFDAVCDVLKTDSA